MAPAKPLDPSILFHPKKKKPGQAPPPPPPRPRPPASDAQRKSPPKSQPDPIEGINPPASSGGKYKEFKLMSSALNGWKYDVMKFDTRKDINIPEFFGTKGPHKLNRKDPPRRDATPVSAPQAVGPMMGPDGKPVIGVDGRVVMVDAEGRPIHNTNGAANGAAGDKAKPGRKKFQKKTRQVYLIPEETRQLRKEERYPWVMEVPSQDELWVAKMEEVSKAETHAFFMPCSGDTFKFVPAHRWYKFQKKPNYKIFNLEEAESMMAKMQKNKDPSRWLAQNLPSSSSTKGAGGSGATTSVSMPYMQNGPSLVYDASTSLGPGGRRLRTVDSGMERGLFGDDDDEDSKKRRVREYGGEGDQDEMDYEEIFQDDEEKPNMDEAEDEEAKEVEERIKKEYGKAKVLDNGEEDQDQDDESKLTKAGRQLRKLMRSIEKNQAYDSDDDDNPYLSEDEESEEETPEVPAGPAVQDQSPQRSQSQPPATAPTVSPAPIKTESSVPNLSRPTSPTQSGHSVVAKRATSPKVPKIKTSPNVSRASSPLAQGPASPSRRPGSPINGASISGSQPSPNRPNNKRKAEDASPISPVAGSNGDQPKPKKAKVTLPISDLTAAMIAQWLRSHPGAKTVECIAQFRPYINSTDARKHFTALVREVGTMDKDTGHLSIKDIYRDRDPPPGTGPKPPPQVA
ncbi:Rap30/74 interaction domain-containing protein [Neolentinus lepideus HHB14362 ss-1]|uniref:Transcription initiation factor IIF subunit alpha n=1 Tax=Neolentinus lepideus HHB14362 ss-1 TaxID=1314782 RepID=A0A165RZW0_9AGAM|nr:Rap30/74 interaction domain-containing protein [Neolentinus lepideus HHB14362 ss-1]